MADINTPVGNFERSGLDETNVLDASPMNFLKGQGVFLQDPQAFCDALEAAALKEAQSGDVVTAIGTAMGVFRKILLPQI